MPYNLTTYDGTSLVTIADGTVDNQATTSLFFIGKNVTGYGLDQNNNFLYLLENFAGVNAPLNPQTGQLWFDKDPAVLRPKVYDGGHWRGLAVLDASTASSANSIIGDLWFDTANKQLWVKSNTGTELTLVGPQIVTGFGVTGAVSRGAKDNGTGTHAIIDVTVNGATVGVFSDDTFALDGNDADYLQGFTTIVKGLNLAPGATLSGLDVPSRNNQEQIDSAWNFTKGVSFGNSTVTPDSNGNLLLSAGSNIIFDAGYVLPNSPTVVIGGVTTPFAGVYASTFGSGSALAPANLIGNFSLTANSKISPALDNNTTLGTVTSKWQNIYSHGLSAGSASNPGTIEGDWILTSNSKLSSNYILTPYLTAATTTTNGQVEGQWTLTRNSTFQATELIDTNGNSVKMSITATSLTIVERDSTAQINATQFNGNVFGSTFTATNKVVAPLFAGNLSGSVSNANTVVSNSVQAGTITASTGITGSLTGNVTGNVAGNLTGAVVTATDRVYGNVTGNVTGNVLGSVQGSMYATDGTQVFNALTKTIGYSGADLQGNLTGDSSGTHTGPVRGAVTGSLTGNSNGTHTGPVVGPVTGNVIGNVQGNVTGNSNGTHTGPVVGNVTGNVTGNVAGDVTGHLYGTADNAIKWDGSTKFVSSAAPDPNAGVDGDFWFQYQA